ncbi:hypothetical protein EV130_101137 [Rhizobium azibense]|uniref:Uncharacterized protein n=1 Tax=Rhizobium azibense TaxID=1136135 RepID=A0A4R3RGV7_9HYPH|nr:hypothetical protein EV130_101137 [Rhizobium azibense]
MVISMTFDPQWFEIGAVSPDLEVPRHTLPTTVSFWLLKFCQHAHAIADSQLVRTVTSSMLVD